MAKKVKNELTVIKALKKANRELEMQRHGADHPWVAVDRPHRNNKRYNRKDQKKELRRDFGSFDFISSYPYSCLQILACSILNCLSNLSFPVISK